MHAHHTPPPCLQPGAEPMIDGDIELKSVTFAYPARPGRLIFKEFNLKIPAGTSCALVRQQQLRGSSSEAAA